MGKSDRLMDPPWSDISKEQSDFLWSGALKKHGETLWIAGHKTVDLYHSLSPAEVSRIMLLGGDSRQTASRLESVETTGARSQQPLNWATSPEIVECHAK
jgi:hypothetical protein